MKNMKALHYFTPNFITLLFIIIVTDIKYNIAIITNYGPIGVVGAHWG